jgi:hypothetical protein
MTTITRDENVVALLFVVATVTVLLATPVVADNSDWIPPGNEHDISSFDYAVMWSLDEDVENASTSNATIGEAIAKETDYAYNIPPEHPEKWNDGDINDFKTTRNKSIHPPDTGTSDGTYAKDAYIRIATLTPSATYHESPDSTKQISPQNGNVYTITDYRVDVPEDKRSETRIVEYELVKTGIVETELTTETGDGDRHTRDTHSSKLSYSELNQGTNRLVVRAEISTEISKTVQEKEVESETVCSTDAETGNMTCETQTVEKWVVKNDTTITSTHTVTDRTSVYAYTPTMSVQYRYLLDGSVIAKYTLPEYWTVATTPGGHKIDGPIETYTQRNTEWDTFVNSTATGTSDEYRSPVNPVETHAFPNDNKASFNYNFSSYSHSNIKITAQDGKQFDSPNLPETIDFTVANNSGTDSWTNPQQVTIEGSTGFEHPREEPHEFTVHSVSAGAKTTVTGERLNEPTETNVTTTVIEKNKTSKTATVEISLTENETGTPINTEGQAGYISLAPGDKTLQTGSDGTTTTTVNYTTGTTFVKTSYVSKADFEARNTYAPAQDTTMIRSELMHPIAIFNFIKPLLAYAFMLLIAYYALYSMYPRRLPWPPWKK